MPIVSTSTIVSMRRTTRAVRKSARCRSGVRCASCVTAERAALRGSFYESELRDVAEFVDDSRAANGSRRCRRACHTAASPVRRAWRCAAPHRRTTAYRPSASFLTSLRLRMTASSFETALRGAAASQTVAPAAELCDRPRAAEEVAKQDAATWNDLRKAPTRNIGPHDAETPRNRS